MPPMSSRQYTRRLCYGLSGEQILCAAAQHRSMSRADTQVLLPNTSSLYYYDDQYDTLAFLIRRFYDSVFMNDDMII